MTAAMQCPICGKPTIERYKPFCSKRCADIDLNQWLVGSYRIAGEAVGQGTDEENSAQGDRLDSN